MLESLIKTILMSIIISLFLILSLGFINNSIKHQLQNSNYGPIINDLINNSVNPLSNDYKIIIGEGNWLICKPSLINNLFGRVCIAKSTIINH